ncbi:MAG: basic secretory protein-like protein [Thermoguttaceae bacterium]
MTTTRLITCALLFVWSNCIVLSAAPTLPDDVHVAIDKKGSTPTRIRVKIADEEVVECVEGEWDKVPAPARPYLYAMLRPTIDVSVDCSDAPEAAEWAENAARVAREQFPNLLEQLDSAGYKPPTAVKLVFKKMDGVAHAAGGNIVISVAWITAHPDDIGMVVHELIHIVQAYRHRVPSWVTEGIADYIRFFVYEKNGDRTCRVDPSRAKYTDSYRTTAAFFNWIVTTQDRDFIKKLNTVCREGKYDDNFFSETTGKTLDELWQAFIESLKKN